VGVLMTISGAGVLRSTRVLATVDGVRSVRQLEDETE
jgi:hypothetical protein